MNLAARHIVLAGIGLLLPMVLASCVGGYGYDTDLGTRYSPGYTEPFRNEVGGWGGGYRVGPGPLGEPRPSTDSTASRRDPFARPAPSIPVASRGDADQQHQ
jgi:hypothetical protein